LELIALGDHENDQPTNLIELTNLIEVITLTGRQFIQMHIPINLIESINLIELAIRRNELNHQFGRIHRCD
jgi:hypothetical protein